MLFIRLRMHIFITSYMSVLGGINQALDARMIQISGLSAALSDAAP